MASCSGGTSAQSQLLVSRLRTGNPPRADIVIMDADGHQRRVVVGSSPKAGVRGVAGRPAWSADGRTIAFGAVVGRRTKPIEYPLTDLFVVHANGSGLRRLTHTGSASTPTWSPDGRTIVFAAATVFKGKRNLFRSQATSLWRMNSNGSDLHRLTPVVQGQTDEPGSFSPDGTRLAFTHLKLGFIDQHHGLVRNTGDIEVMHSDGSGLQKLATESADPAFSSDGHHIAFVSNSDHTGTFATGEDEDAYANELYVMDADGHNLRRLTHTGELSEIAPSWSPDGARIAYAREESGFTKVVAVTNADGSCGREIAADRRGDIWYSQPAWRPGRARTGDGPLRCRHR
jgi:Tol biopolymer transport system component